MNSFIGSRTRRYARLSAALLVCAVGIAACDDSPTDPGDPVDWAATLEGDVIEGTASVTSNNISFNAEIAIENGEEDEVFSWQVAHGTCAQPGNPIGAAAAYPDLEVGADGTAEAEADVASGLNDDAPYIVLVVDDSGDEPVIAACGELEVE